MYVGKTAKPSSEGKTGADEVGMLRADEVSRGPSKVRNMTCARDDDYFGDNTQRKCRCASATREKNLRV